MSISQYNYEAYFLDYYEGRLDAHATQELMDFIARHPELKEEFESYEPVSLNTKEEIKFDLKDSLKKSVTAVNANNFDEFAAEYIEGTLSADMQAQLLNFIKLNPSYEHELSLYKKTKLATDTSVIFSHKGSLKKHDRRRPAAWYYVSAAASVAIIIIAYFMLRNSGNNQQGIDVVSGNHTGDTVTHIVQSTNPVNKDTVVQKRNIVEPQIIVHHATNQNKPLAQQKRNNLPEQPQAPNVVAPEDSVKPVVQNNIPVNEKHDSVAITPVIKKSDTVPHVANVPNNVQQNSVVTNNTPEKKKSVFAFVGSAFKTIGGIFKHPVQVNKYYSASSDKVIAYQLSIGNEKLTLRLKNNAY